MDYGAPQVAGVVRFTDPKLYRREALINERKKETDYLQTLLDGSATKMFEPEIARELESVTTFAAALGLSIDPAAALNFRRDVESTDLKQEISTLQLQLQLDQLKRDADLFRAKMAAQTEPSVGTPSSGASVDDVTSTATAAAADQLKGAIAKLEAALAAGLGAGGKTPLTTGVAKTSPIDEFLERAAYRDLIKSAINAASLDEMHDAKGAALIRLQLDATVFPPQRSYSNTFGMLHMKVVPPCLRCNPKEVRELYFRWLSYVNSNLNQLGDDKKAKMRVPESIEPRLAALASIRGLYDIFYWEVPQPRAPEGASECQGLVITRERRDKCLYYAIALPPDMSSSGGFTQLARLTDTAGRSSEVMTSLHNAKEDFERLDSLLSEDCRDDSKDAPPAVETDAARQKRERLELEKQSLVEAVRRAQALQRHWISLQNVLHELRRSLGPLDLAWGPEAEVRFANSKDDADVLLERLEASGKRCMVNAEPMKVPLAFEKFVTRSDEQRVTLYQMGPREQGQKISTIARAADAVSLAGSIAASFPSSGAGANLAANSTRSAIGKVDALERVPIVVAFAEAGKPDLAKQDDLAFGWLLGPRVRLNPEKKRLEFGHQPSAFELYVDLSVPGWWPFIELEARTAWAPNWRQNGVLLEPSSAQLRKVKVPLEPTSADMAGLTSALLSYKGLPSVRTPTITRMTPSTVSSCATNTRLQIWGDNIWRATSAIIGGRFFDDANVKVLPDMKGVMVDLADTRLPVLEDGNVARVSVLTPYGIAEDELTIERPGLECAKPKTAESMDDGKPIIASVSPRAISICDPSPTFSVEGKNLDDGMTALLGTALADELKLDGKTLTIRFKDAPKLKLAGMLQAPLLLRNAKGAASTEVTVVNADCH